MPTLHMDTENVRATARGMTQGGEQFAQSIQALTRSVQALKSTWEGGDSEQFGNEAQNLVRQLDEQANLFIDLAGRVDREVTEWEETDQHGAGDWQRVVSSGGGPFGASAGVLAGVTFASMIAGLPAWLKSFLDRFFPPAVPPQVNQTTTPSTPKDGFAEIIEKARKEAEAKKQAEAKKKAEALKPKYIKDYPARPDDGTFLAGQEKSDSCSIASTKMALQRTAGIDAKESDLRTASSKLHGGYETKEEKGWGTDPSTLDDLVNNQYGDKVVAAYNNPGTQSIDDLEHAAKDGEGIVVSVKNSEWFGAPNSHSVTVVGVETVDGQRVVLINDPWPPNAGKRMAIPADDFSSAWWGDAMYISTKP